MAASYQITYKTLLKICLQMPAYSIKQILGGLFMTLLCFYITSNTHFSSGTTGWSKGGYWTPLNVTQEQKMKWAKKQKQKKDREHKKRNISVALKLMGWEESLPKLNQKT